MHANFAAVQTMAVLIFLPNSVTSKLDRQSRQLQKTSAMFVFADLTPDGSHFWMTLSPRTSKPVRPTPVPPWTKILATPLPPKNLLGPLDTTNLISVVSFTFRPITQRHLIQRLPTIVWQSWNSLCWRPCTKPGTETKCRTYDPILCCL